MSVKVEAVAMEGFFRHRKSLVTLPERGVVVVTGDNGAGKSSLIEAVAVALWGKTLRGTSPWPGDGRVRVMASGYEPVAAERSHKGSRTTLFWGANGKSESYETTTKAQEALEAVVGTWDVWRRSAVFSSQDAAHFTMATDKERKLLLETILGLDRFDPALEACRADLKVAGVALETARRGEQTWGERLEERKRKLGELREIAERDVLPPKPVAPEPFDDRARREELTSLDTMIEAAEADIAKLHDKNAETIKAASDASAKLAAAQRDAKRLAADNCPACGQVIPRTLRFSLQAAVDSATSASERAAAVEAAAHDRYLADKAELEEEVRDLRLKRNSKAQALSLDRGKASAAEREHAYAVRSYEAAEKRIAQAQEQVSRAAADVAQAADKRVAATEERGEVERDHALLSAVEKVLGLKGVRAHILGKALSGLQAVGNAWLSRICGEGSRLSLELKPYSEKATGGVSDAISIEVHGAGAGYGYRAASGGERRRIDVALLLALAEVAQAANGAAPGSTLWFDEVFDALDSDGVESVASALRDLAQSRTVVVLTHSAPLADRIEAAMRLSVEAGQIAIRSGATQARSDAATRRTGRGPRS